MDLKVGDTVVVEYRDQRGIASVERVTPTGRIVTKGYTFDKDGRQIGSDVWSTRYIHKATDQEIADIEAGLKKERLACRLNDFNFIGLSMEKLEQIEQIVGEGQPK